MWIFVILCILLVLIYYKDYLRDLSFPIYSSSVIVLDKRPRLVVSLTTSPRRIKHIQPVIDSIMKQTIKPDRIYLNLPNVFKRDNSVFQKPLPEFITNNPLVYVNWCEDMGPITKVLPTIELEKDPETLILSIDDDIYYSPDHIELFLAFSKAYPNTCITGTSYMHYDKEDNQDIQQNNYGLEGIAVELVEGFSGVLYRKEFLENINTQWLKENACKFGDDFYISNELRRKNIPIIKIGWRYLPIMKIKPLDYGLNSDALHNGAKGGNGNNYFKCSEFLEQHNDLHINYFNKSGLKSNLKFFKPTPTITPIPVSI